MDEYFKVKLTYSSPFSYYPDAEVEPSLLQELEINSDQILQKIQIICHLSRHPDDECLLKDPDLSGPLFLYLLLSTCSFLSGNSPHFGSVYGISVVSCVLMYCLLSLMFSEHVFPVTTVASVLGYSLVPIVALSAFGIFYPLRSLVGITLATSSVIWSSMSASRLFVTVPGKWKQQPLVAYPCAVVAAIYVLILMF
ncbi:protein YIPF5-like [Zophobas morio]|uniref:protein YIPF5-like n=1 Tax=Zophobas morio TaxID=2755281 RepID=UPI0030834272